MGCSYSNPVIDEAPPDQRSRLKEQISRSRELLSIVKDYKKNSKKTSRFFSKFKIGLGKARDSGLLVVEALQLLEYGYDPATVLERLNCEFMDGDILSTDSFMEELKETFEREKSLLLKLQNRKQKLAVKLQRFKIWRKVYDAVFNSTSFVVFLCSVLFASMGAAAEETTLTMVVSGVMANIKQYIDSLCWDRSQRKYDEKMQLISDIEMILITMDELDKIMELVKQFKTQVELLTSSVESTVVEGTISISLKNIKVKAKAFAKDLNSLEEVVDRTMAKLKNARETLLHILPDHEVDVEAVDAASNEDEQIEEDDEPDINDLWAVFQSAPPNNQGSSSQAAYAEAVDATGTHVEHVEAADEPRGLAFGVVIRTSPGGQEPSQELVVMRGTRAQARRATENSFDTNSDQGCDMDYDL